MGERLLTRFLRWFRARRMRGFQRRFRITATTRILDVGGTPFNWDLLHERPRVTILNLPRALEPADEQAITFVAGDGCRLPFRDRSFDLVFSNSVIEHLGAAEQQAAFASEVARVGAGYYVQTPNRRFPVEQHLFTPLLHWLPRRWQRRIARRFTVWALVVQPSPDRWAYYIEHYLNEVRLLDARSLQALFPGAELRRERLLGLAKSLIAVRIPTAVPPARHRDRHQNAVNGPTNAAGRTGPA